MTEKENIARKLEKFVTELQSRGQALQSRMRQQMHIVEQLAQAGLRSLQIIGRLQVKPVLRRLVESSPEQQRQLSRYRARSFDDM